METLHGTVICRPIFCSKDTSSCPPTIYTPARTRNMESSFWGCRGNLRVEAISPRHYRRKDGTFHCQFRPSSDGSGSMAENFDENDADFVNSVVIEAVEFRSSSDGYMIKMRDGKHVRCVHSNPHAGHLPDYAPHPAIVLKMDDASGLLLPIIVLEMPSVLLMAAVRNVQISRPTIYDVIIEMIGKMDYKVLLVRITGRVQDAYFAKLYLGKIGDDTQRISLDLRPSDAINIAARCKVPIQVNKDLASTDGMKLVEPTNHSSSLPPEGLLFSELDRPNNQTCLETMEFNLVRNMLVAVVEERYKDAAQWRDKLFQLRSKGKKWT